MLVLSDLFSCICQCAAFVTSPTTSPASYRRPWRASARTIRPSWGSSCLGARATWFRSRRRSKNSSRPVSLTGSRSGDLCDLSTVWLLLIHFQDLLPFGSFMRLTVSCCSSHSPDTSPHQVLSPFAQALFDLPLILYHIHGKMCLFSTNFSICFHLLHLETRAVNGLKTRN